MGNIIDGADIKIAKALTQIDEDLERLAMHIANGSTTVNGDTIAKTGPPADFPIDVWGNGELDSGDLYLVSVYTSKKETQSKVDNKAGFADDQNQKNNADMSIQR